MKLLLVLMLSAWLCADLGQTQSQNLDCYQCKFRFNSYCMHTISPVISCLRSDNFCGTTKVSIGTNMVYSMTGCILNSECNRTLQEQSPTKFINYNTTCCYGNLCNSSPHLTLSLLSGLGVLVRLLLV
ncbi:protein Bouncer-like [Microcaecilia unicolor]|uniref:Protein Bouncer-like n=1 Tax=Microcaecilia unicolor TaxID=1415580 RepID=A0A6P7XJE6_9AMPH|nr:protein Bouncer-like [Microcaecilia unicolor]XP_030053311.1 protein Bouncer-like [Microcaecilia unicolor]